MQHSIKSFQFESFIVCLIFRLNMSSDLLWGTSKRSGDNEKKKTFAVHLICSGGTYYCHGASPVRLAVVSTLKLGGEKNICNV